jgi:hypothetical protein
MDRNRVSLADASSHQTNLDLFNYPTTVSAAKPGWSMWTWRDRFGCYIAPTVDDTCI